MNVNGKGTCYLSLVSLILATLLFTIFTSSCTDEKKAALERKLNTSIAESDQLRQSIAEAEGVLQASNQRLGVQRSTLVEYNASIQGYILDHALAVAAIAAGVAGASTLDSNNRYSEDAKNVGLGAVVLATLYAVSHADEISEVFKMLNQADAHVRTLEAEISQTVTSIQQQQKSIQQSEQRLQALTQEQATLNQEIKGT